MPCVLQTKKRYIGYMYESIDQKEPVFDAKGIETVRRDSCAAVSKVGTLLLFTKGVFNSLHDFQCFFRHVAKFSIGTLTHFQLYHITELLHSISSDTDHIKLSKDLSKDFFI